MKTIAVLGTGKTGGEVLKILTASGVYKTLSFNRSHPLNSKDWNTVDAAICFLPGPAFLDSFEFLIAHPKPMVIGSTGYEFTKPQTDAIAALSVPWVISSNFSIGMSLAKAALEQISSWCARSPIPIRHSIKETHHVHKKDAPSGTALLWKKWIEQKNPAANIPITSHRVEDLCGTHRYRVDLPNESMSFEHDATSRAVFADGAVWALDEILCHPGGRRGRVDFFELLSQNLNSQNLKTPKGNP